jgi:hypothetical protein
MNQRENTVFFRTTYIYNMHTIYIYIPSYKEEKEKKILIKH